MKKVAWGVLGTAGIAEAQTIPGMLLADNCRRLAIAGRDRKKTDAFAKTFGFERVYAGADREADKGYWELLKDPDVEAVYIPLPNQMHRDWVIRALESGKHVLCEKPLAASEAEVREMFGAAERNGCLLMEAFAYLHSPWIRRIREEIEKGSIGDLRYLETAFITSDYDLSNIRMRKETLGGAAYDLGCYNTSLILTMVDREPDRVQAIASMAENGVDRYTSALLEFGNVRAAMNCGMVLETEADRRIDRLQIHGSRGKIVSSAEYNGSGLLCYDLTCGDRTETVTVDVRNNYALEIEQFGRAVRGQEAARISKEFSLVQARTLDRILACIGY